MHLLKLSQNDDLRVKANCARTLKNLSSDSSEALEEGAVANLIAMSLEGKEKVTIKEELEIPEIKSASITDSTPPECSKEELIDILLLQDKVVIIGGPVAGKGPKR